MQTLFFHLQFYKNKLEHLFGIASSVPSWVPQKPMLLTRKTHRRLWEHWLGSIPRGGPGPQQQSLHRASLFSKLALGRYLSPKLFSWDFHYLPICEKFYSSDTTFLKTTERGSSRTPSLPGCNNLL